MTCARCGRNHSGPVCGMPRRTSVGGFSVVGTPSRGVTGIPAASRAATGVLEGLLGEAQGHYSKVTELLKTLPPEIQEYAEVLDREGKLSGVIKGLLGQIAARDGARGR